MRPTQGIDVLTYRVAKTKIEEHYGEIYIERKTI